MFLTTVAHKVRVIVGSAGAIDVYAKWVDFTAPSTYAPDCKVVPQIVTATTVDVVPIPGSGVVRNVKEMHFCNNHATVANQVSVTVTDGTTVMVVESVLLLPGERLSYIEGAEDPFSVYDANGMRKTNGAASIFTQRLAADVSNSTVNAAKITGLDYACGVGTWVFEYFILYQSSVVTTGLKWSVNHNGTATPFVYNSEVTTADITTNTSLADQDVLLTTGATKSAWAARVKSALAVMISSGVDTANADMLLKVEGLIVVTVAGNLEFYAASETAVATTIKANSSLRLTKVP